MSDVLDRLAELRAGIASDPAQARHALADLTDAFESAARTGEVASDDWLKLADCYFDLSEFTGAIELMERFLRNYGPNPMVSFKILVAEAHRGLTADMLSLSAKLMALAPLLPQETDTLRNLTRLLRWVDDREAERYEDKWIKADSGNPYVWLELAHRAVDMSQHKWPKGHPQVGLAEYNMRRGRRHLVGARRALQGPYASDAHLWNSLHLLQARAGMAAESAESAKIYFRLEPQNRDGMLRILKLYPNFPDMVTSAEIGQMVERLMARDGEPARYWRDLAVLAGSLGRVSEKRIALERCLVLEPNDSIAGMLLRSLNQAPTNLPSAAAQQAGGREGTDNTHVKDKWWRWPFIKSGV